MYIVFNLRMCKNTKPIVSIYKDRVSREEGREACVWIGVCVCVSWCICLQSMQH